MLERVHWDSAEGKLSNSGKIQIQQKEDGSIVHSVSVLRMTWNLFLT